MKRRTFLSTGPLSLLGLSLPAGVLSLTTHQRQGVQHWLPDLARAMGAKRRSAAFFWPENLRGQIKTTNTFLAARGYIGEAAGAFFSAEKSYCFYPRILRRSQAGLLDMLVPILAIGPDGRWRQVLVLTGFQIEALARAAVALAATDLPIAEILLPLRPVQGGANGYESRLGRVEMITRVQNSHAYTRITVQNGGEVVYNDYFQSQHTLTTQSQIA